MTENEPKLDLEVLDEMADLGIDDLRELIDAFLEQATEEMRNICRAIDAKNADNVANLAHRLAGSCAVCGATSAMTALRLLERSGCQANWPAIATHFDRSVQELESDGQLLADYLKAKNQTLRATFAPPAVPQMSHS